jgi:dienelactone hydrolase
VILACCASGKNSATANATKLPWDVDALYRTPKTYPTPGYHPLGIEAINYDGLIRTPELRAADAGHRVKSIFYESVPFEGKPTRVFAFYGIPKVPKGQKVPGIVLVHGGGGTAFESWVRLWNARGYAAIAMDTCGCIPRGASRQWERHDHGGPAGWGGFLQMDAPMEDHWPYHAVSAVVLAHSLLRAMPEVDPNRIGVTGVSWGGYLTSIVSSVDSRFRFAVPVYGCGFLGENSAWLDMFKRIGKEHAARWLSLWDPSVYLPMSTVPTLWLNGTNDNAYPMDSHQKSNRLPKGPRTLCIRIRMPHGHGGAGENPPEIAAFADSITKNGAPLIHISGQGRKANQVWARWDGTTRPVSVELNYTCDSGKWLDREWKSVPGEISSGGKVTATLPEGTRVYYFNLIDDRGLVVSTEYAEVGP